jgi:hypothetical protein
MVTPHARSGVGKAEADDGVEVFVAAGNEKQIPASEVPDNLRVLPTWIPGGAPIDRARGERLIESSCKDPAPSPADPALVLGRTGAEGALAATVTVSGPNPRGIGDWFRDSSGGTGSHAATVSFRGGRATRVIDGDGDVAIYWKDLDGWAWDVRGRHVDAATVTAVGEALHLDSSPEGKEPVATLPDHALPTGFKVAWQTLGVPLPLRRDELSWVVYIGGSEPGRAHGFECEVHTSARQSDRLLVPTTVGSRRIMVGDKDGILSFGAYSMPNVPVVTWEMSPGVVARAGCADWDPSIHPASVDTAVRMAASVTAVSATDPRLPH